MASIARYERDLKLDIQKQLATSKTPIEKLRSQCLNRGANGIKGFGRQFVIFDDDSNKSLSLDELTKGIKDFRIELTPEEIQEIFKILDADGSGSINFNEFLIALRPPMSQTRRNIIDQAFAKMDKTGDGIITVEDLKGVYSAKKHPQYLNGEKTEEEIFKDFLVTFDTPNQADGKITRDEFINYYSGVSASIDADVYFTLMMKNAWKL